MRNNTKPNSLPKSTIKVKDNKKISVLIYAMCLLPLIFMIISINLNENHLISFIATIAFYIIFLIWYLRDLIKRENEYAIIADSKGLTLKNSETYKWCEISSIETYKEINWLISSFEEKYLKINFENKTTRIIRTSYYDLSLEELASKLRIIGNL